MVHTEKLQPSKFSHLCDAAAECGSDTLRLLRRKKQGRCQFGSLIEPIRESWWEGRDMGNRVHPDAPDDHVERNKADHRLVRKKRRLVNTKMVIVKSAVDKC